MLIVHFLNDIKNYTMPPKKSKLKSTKANNSNRSVLLVVHPTYAAWSELINLKTKAKGCIVTSAPSTNSFLEVMTDLNQRKDAKLNYDCLVLVPGHGCEIFALVPLTNAEKKSGKYPKGSATKQVNSLPGIVWSGNPLYTVNQISEDPLKLLINTCMGLTRHLHLCTCWQGCVLQVYNKMISQTNKEKSYVLSGWKNALTLYDPHVDSFISNGCHPTTQLDLRDNFAQIQYYTPQSTQSTSKRSLDMISDLEENKAPFTSFKKDKDDFTSSKDHTTMVAINTIPTTITTTTAVTTTTN